MAPDYRDIAVAHLAASEVDLAAELGVWRQMAKQAIHELHDEKLQHKRLSEQHHRLPLRATVGVHPPALRLTERVRCGPGRRIRVRLLAV
jgi:hypothetical protein